MSKNGYTEVHSTQHGRYLLIKQKPNNKIKGVSLRDRAIFGNDVRQFSLTGVILAHFIGCLVSSCVVSYSKSKHSDDVFKLVNFSKQVQHNGYKV